jgi:hypothetical protein
MRRLYYLLLDTSDWRDRVSALSFLFWNHWAHFFTTQRAPNLLRRFTIQSPHSQNADIVNWEPWSLDRYFVVVKSQSVTLTVPISKSQIIAKVEVVPHYTSWLRPETSRSYEDAACNTGPTTSRASNSALEAGIRRSWSPKLPCVLGSEELIALARTPVPPILRRKPPAVEYYGNQIHPSLPQTVLLPTVSVAAPGYQWLNMPQVQGAFCWRGRWLLSHHAKAFRKRTLPISRPTITARTHLTWHCSV